MTHAPFFLIDLSLALVARREKASKCIGLDCCCSHLCILRARTRPLVGGSCGAILYTMLGGTVCDRDALFGMLDRHFGICVVFGTSAVSFLPAFDTL